MKRGDHNSTWPVLASLALVSLFAVPDSARAQDSLGTHVILSWNDLGMHCMNKDHDQLSILHN